MIQPPKRGRDSRSVVVMSIHVYPAISLGDFPHVLKDLEGSAIVCEKVKLKHMVHVNAILFHGQNPPQKPVDL